MSSLIPLTNKHSRISDGAFQTQIGESVSYCWEKSTDVTNTSANGVARGTEVPMLEDQFVLRPEVSCVLTKGSEDCGYMKYIYTGGFFPQLL